MDSTWSKIIEKRDENGDKKKMLIYISEINFVIDWKHMGEDTKDLNSYIVLLNAVR